MKKKNIFVNWNSYACANNWRNINVLSLEYYTISGVLTEHFCEYPLLHFSTILNFKYSYNTSYGQKKPRVVKDSVKSNSIYFLI